MDENTMGMSNRSSEPRLFLGILAGAADGFVASAVVNGFETSSSKARGTAATELV